MSTSTLRLMALRIPGDARFVALARDVSARLARHAGCDEPSAEGIGRAVDLAVTRVLGAQRAAGTAGDVEIRFGTSAGALEVAVRFNGRTDGRQLSAELDEVRRIVDRLEFHRDGRVGVFTMTRALPGQR